MTYQLHHGNCIDIMPLIERESVDAVICDPPYGLSFMGKDWDHGVPGEHFWREAYRCVKPGAYLLAFGGTRTFHRLAVAIEDAGWEIRDTVMWVYGQGFPKSHDVSKAIDREAGVEREVIGRGIGYSEGRKPVRHLGPGGMGRDNEDRFITAPSTEAASEWDGWGTALKPAWEPIIVARKPLQGTVAENVQRYGTGAMNIDACRIETDWATDPTRRGWQGNRFSDGSPFAAEHKEEHRIKRDPNSAPARWPANLIHDGSAEVLAGFPMTTSVRSNRGGVRNGGVSFSNQEITRNGFSGHGGAQNYEAGYSDTGSAARFFYTAKSSGSERDAGCDDLYWRIDKSVPFGAVRITKAEWDALPERQRLQGNIHATVKPIALMRYLCKLITPSNGVILDSFCGSGSTGVGAVMEGFNFIGIDRDIESIEIAARRIEHACEKVGIVIEQPMMFETQRETVDRPKQLILL